MKAEAAEIADGSQRPALIFRQDPLGRVLHHEQAVPFRDIHDLVHLTAHAGIMNRNDPLRFLRNGVLDQLLIDVHGVRTDVHKYGRRPPQHESVRGGHKIEGGHDHLVPRSYAREQRRQLRGVGAGGGEQTFLRPRARLDPLAALFRERSVAADLLVFHRLPHIFHFFSRKGGYVKIDHKRFLPFSFCRPSAVFLPRSAVLQPRSQSRPPLS